MNRFFKAIHSIAINPNMAATAVAKVRVYTSANYEYIVTVTPTTTLQQILLEIPEKWKDTYVFVNDGGTPMPHLDRNMIDYNNWYVEAGFIPSIYIKNNYI